MHILFDHGTPRSIARFLQGHSVVEAVARGWDRLTNGELLGAAEEAGFELLLSTDKNIRYQQNLKGRRIAILILGNPQRPAVHRYIDRVIAAVNAATPGSYAEVEFPSSNVAVAHGFTVYVLLMNLAAIWNSLLNTFVILLPAFALVWGYIQFVGKKWVEQRFSKDLEAFKREQQERLEAYKAHQQEELERLRHLLFSRISKIHEKEFEVLPQAWLMLNDLRGAVHRALDLTMKLYPDFQNLSKAKLEEFLRSEPVSWISECQKDVLRNASSSERQEKYYMDALRSHYVDEAYDKHRIFLNYLIEHRIFMTDELREKFSGAERALFSGLTSYRIGKGEDHELVRSGQDEMLNNMQTRIDEAEKAVQKRLRYEEA